MPSSTLRLLPAFVALFGLVAVLLMAAPVQASESDREAIESWLGEDLPDPATPGEVSIEAESMSNGRAWDLVFGLGFIGLLFAIGYGLKAAAFEGMRPWIFASASLGILMFTVVNPQWWQFAGVEIDEDGIAVTQNSASDTEVDWDDIDEIRVEEGDAFPLFADDTMLVIVSDNGDEAVIPRFTPDADVIAAHLLAHLP